MGVWSPDPDRPSGQPSVPALLRLVPELLADDATEVARTLRDRYGYVVTIPPIHPALDADTHLLTHPDDLQIVLQTEPTKFGTLDVPATRDFQRVINNSIVSLSPDSEQGSWVERLRQLYPEFAAAAVRQQVPILAATTRASLADLTGEAARGTDGVGPHRPEPARVYEPGVDGVRLLPAMRRLTLRLLGVSLFSTDIRAHETAIIEAVDALRAEFKRRQFRLVRSRLRRRIPDEVGLPGFIQNSIGTEVSVDLGGRRDRRTEHAIQALQDVADDIVRRREETPLVFDDGLTTWLLRPDPVTGETVSPEVLREEVIGLLIAGHATMSAALTWTFYLLASRPGVQQQIHEEVRETDLFPSLEQLHDADTALPIGQPHYGIDGGAVVDALEYTHRVWQEALRLYPPLPMFGRSVKEPVVVNGASLEPGDNILISPYVTHRDRQFWEDPDRFDPTRFEPDRLDERPEFAYFPFSGGPHSCLGEAIATTEAITVLGTVMATHRVEFADDTGDEIGPHASDDDYVPTPVGTDSAINLQPDRDIHVRFIPRAG